MLKHMEAFFINIAGFKHMLLYTFASNNLRSLVKTLKELNSLLSYFQQKSYSKLLISLQTDLQETDIYNTLRFF